jgi:hypothetical protein
MLCPSIGRRTRYKGNCKAEIWTIQHNTVEASTVTKRLATLSYCYP